MTLTALAKELQTDQPYIEALRKRMRDGTASNHERKMLAALSQLKSDEDPRQQQIRSIIELMTKDERRLLADVLFRFRAIGVTVVSVI